jgi:ribose 5-phosphate isomerase B
LADALRDGRAGRGVLICGTGIGISIAANRHRHVRAAVCHDGTSARLARAHNDANVLALGARLIGIEEAKDCVRTFFTTGFEGGRHARRIGKFS